MQESYFLFDLDSTITLTEILPLLAEQIGLDEKMTEITDQALRGRLPFEESFRLQVELLRQLPINTAQQIISKVPVNEQLAGWIRDHKEQCFIATEHPDVWIEPLLARLHMEGRCFSSKTVVQNGYIEKIAYYLNKDEIIPHFPCPVVAVGDGANDAGMIRLANIGIGFGGVRPIAPAVRDCADYSVFEEKQLCHLLDELYPAKPVSTAVDIFSAVF